RYPVFDGLNLSFETREGILKHCSRRNASLIEDEEQAHGINASQGGVAARFLTGGQPSLEAQLCNLADEIAYAAHDVDDGVRSGLLTLEQMRAVPLFCRHHDEALADHPHLADAGQERRRLYESIRRMLSAQVYHVIDATRAALAQAGVQTLADVRAAPSLVCFAPDMRTEAAQLKQFLMRNLYRHPQVVHTTDAAKQVVADLFACYVADPAQLPAEHQAAARGSPLPRVVADYIAGMTDRMATREHERISGQRLFH
ncbi:MAG: hypothetical protein RLZZ126_1173, partial [Pseudomonadota bacterium]